MMCHLISTIPIIDDVSFNCNYILDLFVNSDTIIIDEKEDGIYPPHRKEKL
jgi:hypothetical protein